MSTFCLVQLIDAESITLFIKFQEMDSRVEVHEPNNSMEISKCVQPSSNSGHDNFVVHQIQPTTAPGSGNVSCMQQTKHHTTNPGAHENVHIPEDCQRVDRSTSVAGSNGSSLPGTHSLQPKLISDDETRNQGTEVGLFPRKVNVETTEGNCHDRSEGK